MKICSICGKEKPFSGYSTNKSTRDGFHKQCKDCKQEISSKLRREYQKGYAKENTDFIKASHLRYRKRNRKKIATESAQWKKDNPEKIFGKMQKYRAKKYNLPHDLTYKQWQETLKNCGNRCVYCGIHQDNLPYALHQDHFVPLGKGGGFVLNNILPACRSCNSRKGDRDPLSFIKCITENRRALFT